MNKKIVPIIIAVIIMAGSGGFFAGLKYGQSKSPVAARGLAGFFASSVEGNGQQRMRVFTGDGTGAGQALRANGGFASGEVLSKDDKSLTIKLRDGGSKIVFYSNSTEVMKTATTTPAELKVGDTVMAVGSANPDGSITAESIQMRPEMPISSPVN